MKKKNLLYSIVLLATGCLLVACSDDEMSPTNDEMSPTNVEMPSTNVEMPSTNVEMPSTNVEVSPRPLPLSIDSLKGRTWFTSLGIVDLGLEVNANGDGGKIILTPHYLDNFLTEAADDKIFADTDDIEFTLEGIVLFEYEVVSSSNTNTVPLFLLDGNINAANRTKYDTFREDYIAFRTALIAVPDADLTIEGVVLKAFLMSFELTDIFEGISGNGAVDMTYILRVASIDETRSRRDAHAFFIPNFIYTDGSTATGALHTVVNALVTALSGTDMAAIETTGTALAATLDTLRATAPGAFLKVDLTTAILNTFPLLTSQ